MSATTDPHLDPAGDSVIPERERLAGIVQAVHQRPHDIPRRRWESLAVFLVSAGAYAWFGYWLVVKMHVVGFETLDRLNRALMIWHNDPAKLSALGFDYPPLATLLISPLAIIPSVVSSLAVVPLTSAIFAGLTMVTLNTLCRRAQIVGPLRYAILVALALNPLVALYAAGGARQVISMAFVVMAMGALVAWYITADVRFVMLSGIAYSVAALAGYSSVLWFVLCALMIGGILSKLGADGQEVEGTTVGFAAPTVYAIALWTVFNLILLLDPFHWIASASDAGGDVSPGTFTAVELLQDTWWMVLYGAPIAIVMLPALIFVGVSRTNPLALWLGIMLGAAIVAPALTVLLDLTDSPMQMRNCLPIILFSVIGGIWLARSADSNGLLVAVALVVMLLASIPWTFYSMKNYRYQNLEAPFAAAISTGRSQEGTSTVNGARIGIVDEQAMADYIKANISEPNSILTDNSQTYAVMLLTGRPDLFFDRVDHSDGPWKDAARDPASEVDYLLMSTAGGDLLAEFFPDVAAGADPRLPVVYSTDRYVLIGVPGNFTADTSPEEVPDTTSTGGAE